MANEWIAELKPGDEILVSSPYQNKRIATVEKITPTGLIKVENMYFNRDGSQRGGDVFGGCRISECSPAKKKELMQERVIVNTVKILRTLTKDSINYEQAVAIMEIVQPGCTKHLKTELEC